MAAIFTKRILKAILFGVALLSFLGAGVLIFVGVTYSQENSVELGAEVLYAKQQIPAGFVFSSENVLEYIDVKAVKLADLVPTAIVTGGLPSGGVVDSVLRIFKSDRALMTAEIAQQFLGLQAITTISTNDQLEASFFVKDGTAENERLFSLPMDYKLGMGGEIQIGDRVDIWVYDRSTKASSKVYSNAVVFKLKGEGNVTIVKGSVEKPVLAIFKMTEDAIKVVREAVGLGDVFLVKYGS